MPTEIIPTSPKAFGYLPGKNQVGGALNGPGCVTVFGHSFMDPFSGIVGPNFASQGGLANIDQSLLRQTLAALGLSEGKCISYAVSTANLLQDNSAIQTGAKGGHVQVLQSLAPQNVRINDAGFRWPWTANPGLVILCYGINDVQNFSGGTQSSRYRNVFKEAYRTVLSRCRAAHVFEALTDTIITTFSGGGLGGGTWSSVADTLRNSGTGYARTSTVGATVTLAIPSDYDGGPIALGFIGRKAGLGGQATITIDGVVTDTINTSDVTADSVSATGTSFTGTNVVITRRYNLTPFQTHTIVITTTGIDGNFDYNFCQFEAKEGNPIIFLTPNRQRQYSGGLNKDDFILDWADAIREVANEFPEPLEEANLDAAIQQSFAQSQYNNTRISYDTIHLSEVGARYGAAAILDAYVRLNETTTLSQSTTNQRDTVGTGFYLPQAPTVAGQFVYPTTLTASAASAMSNGGTTVYAIPVIFTRPCTVSQVVFDSITVATGTVVLGLMHDMGNGLSLVGTSQGPINRVYDWGSFTQTVATPKVFTIPTTQRKILVPGLYWVMVNVQAASTLSCTRLTGGHPYVNSKSAARPVNGACYTYTFGTPQTVTPVSLNPLTSTQGTDPNCPFVALTIASVP